MLLRQLLFHEPLTLLDYFGKSPWGLKPPGRGVFSFFTNRLPTAAGPHLGNLAGQVVGLVVELSHHCFQLAELGGQALPICIYPILLLGDLVVNIPDDVRIVVDENVHRPRGGAQEVIQLIAELTIHPLFEAHGAGIGAVRGVDLHCQAILGVAAGPGEGVAIHRGGMAVDGAPGEHAPPWP